MGAGEESIAANPSKPTSSTHETAVNPPYPDWSSSMQAYYGAGAAPPFFASTVASPTPHPYMWGAQHPMMPSYGTPVPYPALYPPVGVYAHPNMPTPTGTIQANSEPEAAKVSEGKDQAARKRSRGAPGNPALVAAKAGESGKAASGSGNDGGTQSAESGSEGSSDGTDENNSHEFSGIKKGSFEQMLADAQNSTAITIYQNSVPGNPVASVPATNLNIGMGLWNASSAAPGAMKMRPNHGVPPAVGPGMIGDQWVQDERELKRQKRKQSNRESARRSRLRKQAGCEELQQGVETLNTENHTLKDELQRLSEECEKLTSENNAIKDELTRLCGPEAVSKLESNSVTTQLQSRANEHDS